MERRQAHRGQGQEPRARPRGNARDGREQGPQPRGRDVQVHHDRGPRPGHVLLRGWPDA